jgi:hypothetical protein
MVKFLLWMRCHVVRPRAGNCRAARWGIAADDAYDTRPPGLNPACTHSSPPAAKKFPEILRPCAYCAESSSIAVNGTSKSKSSRKAIFVAGWAVVWGGSTALVLTLSDRHQTGHFDTPFHSAVRFAIFMIGGIFNGLYMWKLLQVPRKQLSPTMVRVQFAVFVALMLGLAYMAWRSF